MPGKESGGGGVRADDDHRDGRTGRWRSLLELRNNFIQKGVVRLFTFKENKVNKGKEFVSLFFLRWVFLIFSLGLIKI